MCDDGLYDSAELLFVRLHASIRVALGVKVTGFFLFFHSEY